MGGHATYALLDLGFLAVVAVVGICASVVSARRVSRLRGAAAAGRWRRTTISTGIGVGVVLLVMTIVFDNVIILLRIVAYDPARISGVHVGYVPIEDLGYAIAAVVLLPSLAVLLGPREPRPAPDPGSTLSSTGRRGTA